MAAPQFGTDGLRGVANTEITPEVAFALAQAAVAVLGSGRFIIGRDTRISGVLLEASLVAGFCSAGADVEILGVTTTPAVAWVSAQSGTPAVMISASHNPFQDNGLKLFASDGRKLSDLVEAEIQTAFEKFLLPDGSQIRPTGKKIGQRVESIGTKGWEDSIVDSVDEKILAGVNIVVDCAHGSASVSAPAVLARLGATVFSIGVEPDGCNINDGYGSTDTGNLQQTVSARGADLGVAFDGDADRLIAVDAEGNRIDGDRLIGILAKDLKSRGKLLKDSVAVTVMTNLGFHHAMHDAGIETITTKVGDRHVLQAMEATGCILGGEQSGHIICSEYATTGDGLLAAVQLLAAVVRSGTTIAELASQVMTQVPQVLENVKLPDRSMNISELLSEQVRALEEKFGTSGRVLVRPSGTEPLVRIMVEHADEVIAKSACAELVEAANDLIRRAS